jgi:hypothetical protein
VALSHTAIVFSESDIQATVEFVFNLLMLTNKPQHFLGIYGLESTDIAAFIPEIAPLLGQCKFGLSCQHDEEPGCAVR